MTENHALKRLQGALEGKPDIGRDPPHPVLGQIDDLFESMKGGLGFGLSPDELEDAADKLRESVKRKVEKS